MSNIHRLVPLLVMSMAGQAAPPSFDSEHPVFYDPWPITPLDQCSMQRGGRWRALARWRNWWRRDAEAGRPENIAEGMMTQTKKPYVETENERLQRESKLNRLGRLEEKANEGRFEKEQPVRPNEGEVYAHDPEFLRGESDGRDGLAPQATNRAYIAGHMSGQQQRIRASIRGHVDTRVDDAVQAAVRKDAEDASMEELEAASRILTAAVRDRTDPPTIAELQKEVRTWTIQKGWVDDRTVGDLLLLMTCEIAEAFEEYRNHHEPAEIYVNHGKPEGIPIELADVVIRILSFCAKYDINLQDAILQKMAYNETREYRHGGKRA